MRASLVAAILEIVGGFTLLGDPAQAIYDHQVAADADTTSSDDFIEGVRDRNPDLRTLSLERELPGQEPESDDIERIGTQLRDVQTPIDARLQSDLAEIYRDLEPLGCVRRSGGRRSAMLVERLPCSPARTSTRCGSPSTSTSRTSIIDCNARPRIGRSPPGSPSCSGIRTERPGLDGDSRRWPRKRSRQRRPGRGDRLASAQRDRRRRRRDRHRDRFGAASRSGSCPTSSSHRPRRTSWCRRSIAPKGLEFDLVFTPPPTGDVEDQDDIEELRVLYVALSRARDEVWKFPLPSAEPWRKDPAIGDRWVRSVWGERWKTPASSFAPVTSMQLVRLVSGWSKPNPGEAQDYLRDQVRRGDPIELQLVHVRDARKNRFRFFAALHAGRASRRDQRGARACALPAPSATSSGSTRWPELLTGATCDGVETVVGMTSEADAAGIGSSGLWLRPRLVGLADLRWRDDESKNGNRDDARRVLRIPRRDGGPTRARSPRPRERGRGSRRLPARALHRRNPLSAHRRPDRSRTGRRASRRRGQGLLP